MFTKDNNATSKPRWKRRLIAVAAATLASLGMLAAVETDGNATPASGVSTTLIALGASADTIKLDQARGATDVVVIEITIQPGGTAGWHYHTGQLIGVVKQGTFTREMDDCTTVISQAGDVFLEEPGPHHVHVGRNLGTVPVILDVTYFVPHGSPGRVDADPPACATTPAG